MNFGFNMPSGFRFHPTDEELVRDYLVRKCAGLPPAAPIIAEVDLYKHEPWSLPKMAFYGEKEWFFFSPRNRKYPNGVRPNRFAGTGFWKATGADKPIGRPTILGIKKALVFYAGRPPHDFKTNWIMHEYRLANVDRSVTSCLRKNKLRLDDWVLCRVYNKKGCIEKYNRVPEQNPTKVQQVHKKNQPEVQLGSAVQLYPQQEQPINNLMLPPPPIINWVLPVQPANNNAANVMENSYSVPTVGPANNMVANKYSVPPVRPENNKVANVMENSNSVLLIRHANNKVANVMENSDWVPKLHGDSSSSEHMNSPDSFFNKDIQSEEHWDDIERLMEGFDPSMDDLLNDNDNFFGTQTTQFRMNPDSSPMQRFSLLQHAQASPNLNGIFLRPQQNPQAPGSFF